MAPPQISSIMANTYTQIYVQVVFAVEARQYLIQRDKKEELHKFVTGIDYPNFSIEPLRSAGESCPKMKLAGRMPALPGRKFPRLPPESFLTVQLETRHCDFF
jgi:hypothetical protein